jgi:hypothetical protein
MYFNTISVKSTLMLHNCNNYLSPMWAKCILVPFQLKAHLCYKINKKFTICTMCTKVRKNIVGLKTTLKCAFVCNRDKKAPSYCPFFFRRPSSSSSFARECRTSLFTAAAALVRAISSLYLSRVPLRRACRPSFRTQYAVGLCLVLLSARGSVRS